MADELDALVGRIDDGALRQELTAQISRLRQRRQFGLVFEEHLPERVVLPHHAIRRGTKVVSRDGGPEDEPRVVVKVSKGKARLAGVDGDESVDIADLVAVAEFGEPIYPGLKRLGSIARGGDKPAHVIIKGENYHALEALQFTHAGKVDCIYIDPPYNTGARDWKYNNDYVDHADGWRHSKWLAFMRRRLLEAQPLLTENGVLIVTIDEHEVHHLGMLLRQLFPAARVQMVTVVINPAGVAQDTLARVEEYAFYCFFGKPQVQLATDDLLSDGGTLKNTRTWHGLMRTGTNALPSDGPTLVYPIRVSSEGRVLSAGRTLRERIGAGEVAEATMDEWLPAMDACEVPGETDCWPIRSNGTLGNWRMSPGTLLELAQLGFVRARPKSSGGWALSYVATGIRKRVESGKIKARGRDERTGELILDDFPAEVRPRTVWKRASHHAGWHGSSLLNQLLGERRFDFPKSLYLVEDSLRIVIGDNREALVLDFFGGSGTTAHAVARLNRQDGGSRRSIVVTNNEVSDNEAKQLRADGLQRGDTGWEAAGIFESVTRPRLESAVTGLTPAGVPVEGDYRFTDESPISEGLEENLEFVELEYLDAESVSLDRAFEAIAPLLWMRAGSNGPVLTGRSHDESGRQMPYVLSDSYAVLFNPDRWRSFVDKLAPTVTHVFVVTDSSSEFANVSAELPPGIEIVRLYENYLSTFAINAGTSS